ncbi:MULTISPECIES: hypothetical protein [unclassified Streptomyces]|uniref:hypothetical protein n=1 Tax=unclassified Streptomyces TaxID=2593676 RepID=UPI0034116A50
MDVGDWIALSTGTVSVGAAAIAIWQARTASASASHSDKQARAADEQVRVAHEQLQQADRLHREQLALAERIHREQNEPYVIVDIQPSDPTSGILVVVIENIGPTVVRDERISWTSRPGSRTVTCPPHTPSPSNPKGPAEAWSLSSTWSTSGPGRSH